MTGVNEHSRLPQGTHQGKTVITLQTQEYCMFM